MTVHAGRWRLRFSWRKLAGNAIWYDRTRFAQGTVYRARAGWLMVKVLVDRLSPAERLRYEQSAAEFLR